MKTLLALDMDGTLLNSKKEISPRTRSALKRFHDLGGIVALSTGRGMVELSDYPEEIEEFVDYGILLSGAMIYDFNQKETLYYKSLPDDLGREVVQKILMEDVMIQFMDQDKSVLGQWEFDHMDDYHILAYKPMYERIGTLVEDMKQYALDHAGGVGKANFYHLDPEARLRSRDRIKDYPVTIAFTEKTSLEVSPFGVSKGKGLEMLCSHLGYNLSDSVAVGDSNNDLTVLQTAGLSVAMGNATEEILSTCDMIVADNDHDGIAEVVDYLISQKM